MSYPTYNANPTDTDVQTYLTGAGLWLSTYSSIIIGTATTALKRFQSLTGRTPFLSSGSATNYYFDAPPTSQGANRFGNVEWNIPLPFTSISALAINCTPTDSTGSVLTSGTDFYLGPQNYDTLGLPIEQITFVAPIYGNQRSVRINGVVGSYTTWPADAWHAVVMGACAIMGEAIGANTFGGATTIRDDDQTISAGANPFGEMMKVWQSRFDAAVNEYTRIRVE